MHYFKVLERMHNIIPWRNYVEIGVCQGKSLVLSKTVSIGIDPRIRLTEDVYKNKPVLKLFQVTSDDFFKRFSLYKELDGDCVHLSFIDGLHLFEQVLKDFINIEKFSDKNTIVLFHDVIPVDVLSAQRERQSRMWVGDVWKIFQCLSKYRPDLDLTVIDAPPSGLIVVKNLDSRSTVLEQNYSEICNLYLQENFDSEESVSQHLSLMAKVKITPRAFLDSLSPQTSLSPDTSQLLPA